MIVNGYEISPYANLHCANLHSANLHIANLYSADLYSADLRGADLRSANLYGANLYRANLHGTDLHGADLRGANLYGANLYRANLHGANLHGADLRGANLCYANLRDANLRDANLRDARLCDADITGAKFGNFSVVPSSGEFVGWKKLNSKCIARLLIPAKAKRVSSLVGRKCRAEYVKVLDIIGDNIKLEHRDTYKGLTEYKVGAIVRADSFDDDIRIECTHGIHFFITEQEAIEY